MPEVPKVYNAIVLLTKSDPQIISWLEKQGAVVELDQTKKFDVVLFGPGPDVAPFFYGQKRLKYTQFDIRRDMEESKLYRRIPIECPKIGIGRGAQFLCVMNGGSLYQHVTCHARDHEVIDFVGGNSMKVVSKHHQEMILPSNADLLAAASESIEKHTDTIVSMYDPAYNLKNKWYHDTEVAWVPSTNCLLFQPRPEFEDDVAGKNTRLLFESYFKSRIYPNINNMYGLI